MSDDVYGEIIKTVTAFKKFRNKIPQSTKINLLSNIDIYSRIGKCCYIEKTHL